MFKLCLLVVAALALGLQAVKGIVGGIPAWECHYHVLMKRNGEFFCNGALITAKHVLTDASCIEFDTLGQVTATVGTNNILEDGITYPIVQDKTYTSIGSNLVQSHSDIRFNLGIYTLQSEVSSVIAIPLDLEPPLKADLIGTRATVSALGPTQPEGPTCPTIQQLFVQIISLRQCEQKAKQYNINISPAVICAFSRDGTGITQWDNGGPLVQSRKIIGIAAITPIPIAKGNPSIFISYHYYKQWIMNIIFNT